MGNLFLKNSEGENKGKGLVERKMDEGATRFAADDLEGEIEDSAASSESAEDDEPMWVLLRVEDRGDEE